MLQVVPPAQHSESATNAPVSRRSPRFSDATAIAAFSWAEPKWIECRYEGTVLVQGSKHSLPYGHHRCFDPECAAAAQQHFVNIRCAPPEATMASAAEAGRPSGAVYQCRKHQAATGCTEHQAQYSEQLRDRQRGGVDSATCQWVQRVQCGA